MDIKFLRPDDYPKLWSPPVRRTGRRFSSLAAVAAAAAVVLVTDAAAAPKAIVVSGALQGLAPDIGGIGTGDTFRTTGGTFVSGGGVKSGTYSSAFTLGSATSLPGLGTRFVVTGTFTLATNGGTITAVVVPVGSFAVCCATPSSMFSAFFPLQLQVVGGTGRFKKMTGALSFEAFASMCGALGQTPTPPCPSGVDPVPDWRMTGTVMGTLTRTTS